MVVHWDRQQQQNDQEKQEQHNNLNGVLHTLILSKAVMSVFVDIIKKGK